MRNVSSAFKQALANDNRAYLEYADFVLADETELHITNANLWQGGFSFEDSVSSGSIFEVGSAIINKATLVLNNIYEGYDGVDFFGATVTLSIGLTIGENIETIQLGKYTVVNNPTYNGSLITIEMYDNMYKFDEPYSHSNLTYPASLDTIVRDACTWCGVTLITQNFPNNDFVVAERPDDENMTFREVLAYAAQIAGCYARCDSNGYLTLKWFDQESLYQASGGNLIPYPYQQTTRTVNRVTFTDNEDGTITVNGTATANCMLRLQGWTISNGSIPLDTNLRYTLSGCPSGGTTSTYCISARVYEQGVTPGSNTGTIVRDTGSGKTLDYAYAYISPYLSVFSGTTVNNVTFNPKLRVADSQRVAGVHYIDSIYSKQFSVDDVVITGVRVSINVERETTDSQTGYTTTTYETVEYLEGSEGYVISIENNPLIAEDQVEDVAEYLGTRINGFAFKTADVSHSSDPSIEAGDVAICIDLKGNRYPILVSSTTFKGSEAQSTQSIAEEPVINAASRISVETKNYVAMRKLLAAEKTERERVEDDLSDRIDNAQGLFETQVQQTGGGVITYLHDKPLLAESDIQIKVSTVGVTVTANGTASSPTWYGLTVDGQLISNILTTAGVNADWINTGQLVVTQDGNEVFFADIDTGAVRISGESIHISPGDPIDSAMGYTLETPFTYSNNGQTANFSAVLYHRNIDVTSQFPASWFTWTLRTENGETSLGDGKNVSVAKSSCSYGATVTCKFTTYEQESELTDVDDAQIEDVDDTPISTFTHVEGSRNIVDTPVKLQSSILLTDYIVSVSAAEIYRTTHNEYGQFIYDNFVATPMAGKVAKAGDTMTGALVLKSSNISDIVPLTTAGGQAYLSFLNSNDNQSGWLQSKMTADGYCTIDLYARFPNTTRYAYLRLGTTDDGTQWVGVSGAQAWRNAISAVYRGGDTMSGDLQIAKTYGSQFQLKSTDISTRTNATAPSSDRKIGGIHHIDSNSSSNVVFYSETYFTTERQQYTSFITRRFNANASSSTSHGFYLRINNDGTLATNFTNAAARDAWMDGLNALSRAGGTITGNIDRKVASVDASKANNNISSAQYPTIGQVIDGSNRVLARLETVIETGGNIASYWYVRNYNTSGTYTGQKGIRMSMNKSGTLTYTVGDAANFRSAIGLGNVDNTFTNTATIADIITVNTTNATITSANYVRYGKIAQIYIVWTNKSAITVPANGNVSNITIGTLVSGKRPQLSFMGMSKGDNAGQASYAIYTGGSVALSGCDGTGSQRIIAADSTFEFYATYIVA